MKTEAAKMKPARLAEDAAIFDFELSDMEMAQIAALDRGERSGADPMNSASRRGGLGR